MRSHWCACGGSIPSRPTKVVQASTATQAKGLQSIGRNATYDKIGRGSTYKSHKEIQVCRLSLCCQSRDTRGTPCKRTAWGTQLADVYGRRRISAKYHKTKTPKRHYERISRREREENNVLTCPLYLLGAITYEQNKTISGRKSILLCSSCLFI